MGNGGLVGQSDTPFTQFDPETAVVRWKGKAWIPYHFITGHYPAPRAALAVKLCHVTALCPHPQPPLCDSASSPRNKRLTDLDLARLPRTWASSTIKPRGIITAQHLEVRSAAPRRQFWGAEEQTRQYSCWRKGEAHRAGSRVLTAKRCCSSCRQP